MPIYSDMERQTLLVTSESMELNAQPNTSLEIHEHVDTDGYLS